MKQIILSFIVLVTITLSAFGQSPEGFKYQAIVRNASSAIIANQAIGMQLSIIQGSATGPVIYQEQFAPTTNTYGLVNLEIGTGITTEDFSLIDWMNGPYFLKTSIDATGGTIYADLGISQLMSVPFALHSKTAENVINDAVDDADNDPTNEIETWGTLTGIPSNLLDGDDVNDADADPSNELQAVSFSNDTLYLSNGGQVYLGAYATDLVDDADADPTNELQDWSNLPGIPANIDTDVTNDFDGDYNSLTNQPNIPTVPTNVSAFINDAGYVTTSNDADSDPTNELQNWSNLPGIPTNIDLDVTDDFDGNYNSLTNQPILPAIPSNVSAFANDAGYVTTSNDADADASNEIQDLQLVGNDLSITNNLGATAIDLAGYLDNTDTQLDSAGVVALGFVAEAHTDSTAIANMGFVAGVHPIVEFQRIGNTVSNTTDIAGDDFVFGSTSLGDIGSAGNRRLFFDKSKGAFRAGLAYGVNWDDANVGVNSVGLGLNVIASGSNTVALGNNTSATEQSAVAIGNNAVANGASSAAFGRLVTASGQGALAMGNYSTANGISSIVIGDNSTAVGTKSMALGNSVTAIENYSTAIGNGATSSGRWSTSLGYFTASKSAMEISLGSYNTDYTPLSVTSWNATDRLFVIGNGTGSGSKSDAMVILKNGNTGIGTSSPSATLDVAGTVQIVDGTEALGKVLTSDAAGNATWQTPAHTDSTAIANMGFVTGSGSCGLSIGDIYQGGIIFYLDASGCHGLIAAPTDQSTGIQWYNSSFTDTYASGSGLFDGDGNCYRIRSSQGDCVNCNAAELCLDLNLNSRSDWYLPSKYELNLMYENIGQGDALGLGNVGGFTNFIYWSSTENNVTSAFVQYFLNGNQSNLGKSSTYYVRAVRAF